MVPLKSVAVQWLEYLNFDIDTVMNKQYLEKAPTLRIKNLLRINFFAIIATTGFK